MHLDLVILIVDIKRLAAVIELKCDNTGYNVFWN